MKTKLRAGSSSIRSSVGGVVGDRRAQAAVVGIVLLVGVVAIGSIGILLLGTDVNEQSQAQAQDERVRQSFVELDKDLDSVSETNARSRVVDLDLPDESDVAIRRKNAGRIVVNRTNLTTTGTVVVKRIGAIVYEHDGTHYAYQAGAVWKGTGNETQLVSAPSIEYDSKEDGDIPTLTLPISDLKGAKTLNKGPVEVEKVTTHAPLNDVATIDNQVVTLEITSDYYVGWADYFRSRYENVLVNVYHDNDTAQIKLGRPGIDGEFDHAIYAMDGEINTQGGSSDVNGPVASDGGSPDCASCSWRDPSGEFEPLDPVIEEKIRKAEQDDDFAEEIDLEDGEDMDATGDSTYYDEDGAPNVEDETIDVDLSAGNVTLIVNGSLNLTQNVEFKIHNGDDGGDHAFRVYMTGDLGVEQSVFCVAPCSGGDPDGGGGALDGEDNQIYGTSNTTVAIRGGSNTLFEGVIYAPREEEEKDENRAAVGLDGVNADAKCDDGDGDPWHADFCVVSGSSSFHGAAITGPAQVSQNGNVSYDPGLFDESPALKHTGVVPPPLTFLHVAVNKVCVSHGDCESAPIAQIDAPVTMDEDQTTTISVEAWDYDGGSVSVSWALENSDDGDLSPVGPKSVEFEPDIDDDEERVIVEATVTDDEGRTTTVATAIHVDDDD